MINVENGITGKMTMQKAQPIVCLGDERSADMAKCGRMVAGDGCKAEGTNQREKDAACSLRLSGFFVGMAGAKKTNPGSFGTGQ